MGLRAGPGVKTSIEDIQRKTAEFYKLDVKDFHSPQRARRVARPAPGGDVSVAQAHHPLAARDRPALRRPRPHHGAACLPPHRGADRRGSAVPPGGRFPLPDAAAAGASSRAASRSPRKSPIFRRRKNAGFAGVFFALSPPFWYGLPLESWGRLSATGICSKTQENWGFPGILRAKRGLETGLSAMGRVVCEAEIRPMKINVERGAFLKALSHVQSVVERRNTIPDPLQCDDRGGQGRAQAHRHRSRHRDRGIHSRRYPAQRLRHRARPHALRHRAQAARRRPGAGRAADQRRRTAGGVGRLVALRAGLPAARKISPRWRRAPCPTVSGWRRTTSSASSTRPASPSRPKRRAITSTASMSMPPRTPSRR